MKVRKFFAPSSREALKLVRAELGADAVVLSNRVVDGGVELVALTEDSLSGIVEDPSALSSAAASVPPSPPADAPTRVEPALRSAPSMPMEADPFDDVEPFEGYGPSAFGAPAQPSPMQQNQPNQSNPFGFTGRGRPFEPARTPASTAGGAGGGLGQARPGRPADEADDLPGGFARRAFPTLQPGFDGPASAQQGRRFTPRDEAPLAERSDRDRRLAQPVETRDDALRAQAEEALRAPTPYRPVPGLHSPMTHSDNANGQDRTRALPGVLAAKAVGDDGASALAYVHRATQTAYLQQRRAREEAEAAAAALRGSPAASAAGGIPGQPGADGLADAGWTGEARSPRQRGDRDTQQSEFGGQARPSVVEADARPGSAAAMNDAARQAYGQDQHADRDAFGHAATYGDVEYGKDDMHGDDDRDDAAHLHPDYFLDEPAVPFARAAERGQSLSGVAGLARPERDDETAAHAHVLGLARAERGVPEAQTLARLARDAAGLQAHKSAPAPMTASEAVARGLGTAGEVIVRPAMMPREEQDSAPLPEAALMDVETSSDTAGTVDSATPSAPTVDDAAAQADVTAAAPHSRHTSTAPAAVLSAREYGSTRYAATTRVKASFATFPGSHPAIGNPTASLRAMQPMSQMAVDAALQADGAHTSAPSAAAVETTAATAAAPIASDAAQTTTGTSTDSAANAPLDARVAPRAQSDIAGAPADASASLLNDAFGVDADAGDVPAPSPINKTDALDAAAPAADAAAPAASASANGTDTAASPRSASAVLDEMRNLCGALGLQLEAIDQSERIRRDPVRNGVTQMMLACGFSAQLVRLMLDKLPAVGTAEEGLAWVKATFERNLPVLDNEDALMERGGVFALMGPTGVGKTTTTAKLAARAVMRHGADRVALLTTDSYRIGAHEQLRIYGRILGVAVHAVKDASDLSLVLSELRNKHMVLIDTIGMSQRDRAVSEQVAMLRGAQMPVKRLLLLNATSHGDTLNEVVRAYGSAINAAGGGNAGESESGLSGCIITKVDESNGIGAALDTVMRHRLPVHYVSNGQKVPEDLRVARRGYLIDNAFSDPHRVSPFQPDAEALAMLFAGEDQRIAQSAPQASTNPGVGTQPASGEAHYGSSHG